MLIILKVKNSLISNNIASYLFLYYRSINGLQNFSGYLEYFGLGNSSANSSCTETSDLTEDDQLILVSSCISSHCTDVE